MGPRDDARAPPGGAEESGPVSANVDIVPLGTSYDTVHGSSPSAARPTATLVLLVVAVALLPWLAVPASANSPTSTGAGAAPRAAGAPGFSATVTWNGQNVAGAGTAASAIPTSFGDPASVVFSWSQGGPSLLSASESVSSVQLHVVYLGQQVWSRDQVFQPADARAIDNTTLGADLTSGQYLIEGVYEVTAQIVSVGNGTLWSENFFLHVTAPDQLTLATVGLALIAAYELYSLARVGPHAAPRRRGEDANESDAGDKGGR